MDRRCRKALRLMKKQLHKIKRLYPALVDLGKPCYMCSGTRIHFPLKLKTGRYSIQYARLKLECHLGRRLGKIETVDHIDGNRLNNKLSNLQALSHAENCRKGASSKIKEVAALKSSVALKSHFKIHPPNRGSLNGNGKLTETKIKAMRKLFLNYKRGDDSKIASRFGVSRETVSQIRRGILWSHLR